MYVYNIYVYTHTLCKINLIQARFYIPNKTLYFTYIQLVDLIIELRICKIAY